MKKSFYQWLFRAVLALTCLLTTTSAWAETWTVAGTPGVLFGSEWSPTTTANDMINVSGNDYILFKNVAYNGSISFKVCKDHAWAEAYPSENYSFDCPAETKGVLFQFNSKTKSVNVIALPSFTVAGNNTTLFGSSTWSASNADNDMTTTDGLTYTWTKENVELSEGDVLFKVCENHAWGTSYPSDNYCLNIPNNGTYNVTITMNSVSHDISATATLIQTTPDVYYVAGATNGTVTGSNDALFGTAWNATGNEMTTTDDTHYTWTSGQATLSANDVVAFKVVKNGSEWIGDNGSNITCTATQNGIYTLTVTYTVDGTPVGTLNLVETIPDLYYVVGEPSSVFPSGWNISDDQLMIANGDIWTWTKSPITLSADATISFKVKKKSGNAETWIPEGANITVTPQFGAGNYTLTINYDENFGAPTATLTPLFVTTPVFTPAAGTYDTNQDVTITAGTGTIYYTTDGSDPADSDNETRVAYTGPISVAGEGEHVIKAVSVYGDETSEVVTAEYVIKYLNIYVMGSVGKAHAWVYDYSNPELITSDGITYSGVIDVLTMTDDPRPGAGLFVLTTGYGSDYDDTKQYMIGAVGDDNFWIDDYLGQEVDAAPIGQSKLAWSIVPPNGHGTYEFFYNRSTNKFMLAVFDGPTIYVYDYTRPYIYVEDADHVPFDGVRPGNPIQILDETVGGHSGLSEAADGTGDGLGKLGWYKFAVPIHKNELFNFQFHHNGDKKVIDSPFYENMVGDVYYYWDGAAYQPIDKTNTDKLRRIVAHVRVQGTTVPICDGVPMNGPSSFYGQMYYWMAVTTYDKGENIVISDGTHHYEGTIHSDIYLEWTDENSSTYELLSKSTLENRLATKTGRGTVIHLLKNKNTPTNQGDYVLGIDTEISSNGSYYNSTNVGTTWWGNSINSAWAGTESWHNEANTISNYNNSRFLYAADGLGGNPDVFTITAENGTEWYTWYSDRSTATIKFGYGTPLGDYPNYITGTMSKDGDVPEHPESVYKFFANYESPQTQQTAGELWYVWTPDFNATLNDNQSQNNGELIDVTRTYESRAKQKALCSTFRDGNYVYYTDIKGWGDENVYCYVWPVSGLEWPGLKMVKVGYDDEGHPVYLADLSNYDVSNATGSTGGIIFNNGHEALETNKRQTGDLPFENQGCYDYLGLLYRIGGNIDVIENEPDGFPTTVTLTGVWYSRVKGTLLAKGDNDYNNKSVNGMGYKDFAKTVNDGNEDGTVLQSWDYDQSNWVEIYPSEDGLVDAETLIDLIGKPFTLYGTKTNSVNPSFTAISISNVGQMGEKYKPNHFTPIHLNGSTYQYRKGENEWYFFVEPKPNEFAIMDWAIYGEGQQEGDDYFYTGSNTGFEGKFNVDWSYHDKFNQDGEAVAPLEPVQMADCGQNPGNLQLGQGYKGWFAIIKVNQPSTTPSGDDTPQSRLTETDSAGKYTVCPIYLSDEQIMTAIETINADKAGGMRTLKATRYYNLMGVESSTPFEGVNIVVREYTDGSRESSKMIMR